MLKSPSSQRFAAALLAGTCIAGFAVDAAAQIEEIVVTTRKRAENLQEVPIVVTAFTAETIERRGIADLKDAIKNTPGVQFDEGFAAQDTRVVIRGLAPTRGRPNVAFLQDDADISSEAISTAGSSFLVNPRLFDIERIEIVKGPHSALFGRSAFAGAINYITKKPGDTFEARASMDIGSYGKIEGKGSVSGPVNDRLSVGVTASGWTFGGFYRNTVTGNKVGGGDGGGGAFAAVLKPTDNFKVTTRLEYSKDHYDVQARAQIPANVLAPIPTNALPLANARLNGVYPINRGVVPDAEGLQVRLSSDPRRTIVDDYPGNDREIGRAWLRGELDMGPVRFTSITHFGQGDVLQNEDAQRQGDHSNLTIAAVNDFKTRTQLLTQELRLQNTDVDSRLNWTVGGLYWFENVSQTNMSLTCFLPTGQNCGEILRRYHAAGLGQREFFRRKTHHYSAYALVEFDITEQLGISAEVRHTWEDEDLTVPRTVDSSVGCSFAGASLPFRSLQLNGTLVCAGPPGPPQPFRLAKTAGNYGTISTQNKFWAPRVGVDYKINDELLVYASVAKGVKPGGVSTLGGGGSGGIDFVSNAYEREQIWVYEIGEKSTLFDGSVQFNVAGYYQDFSDKQASTQLVLPSGSTGTRIVNAAKARVWGVDVEGAWAATENLTLTLGYTWNDAKFKEYKLLQSSLSTITSVGNCTQVRTPTNALLCELDRSGYTLERSPKHSLQFTPTWRAPIAGGDLNYLIEASFLYTSERFESDDNQFILPSYWVVDMRIGLQNDNFEIIGYVNNMFNDDTIKSGFASPDFVRSYCLGGAPCNFVPPLNTPPFNFVLPNHFTAALPDKRQFGIRASYKF